MNYTKLREDILLGNRDVDSLSTNIDKFNEDYFNILKGDFKNREIDSYIRLCLDYYAYSGNGDVLISDHQYDLIMQYWMNELHGPHIVYPDAIVNNTTWGFVKHEAPGMVGTVSKVYSEEELDKYLLKFRGIRRFRVAPKFDGISTCIKSIDDVIQYGVTRADGIAGQDITAVVKGAKNSSLFATDDNGHRKNGFYKCELCVGQNEFLELKEEKPYKNRRSATSGIVNSPKNLMYAKYITIIPLLYNSGNLVEGEYNKISYIPPWSWGAEINNVKDAMHEIYKMLSIIKNHDFPFRTDGVILYPESDHLNINDADYMQNAIAYKINTAEGRTKIKYGYMSIGRMGNAIPMAKVEPVEVNETIVEDVSLGSYDKYAGMDLHEEETVIIYSAGDVIPQMKLPDPREYPKHADYLKIKLRCSYCNEKLERIGNEYKCVNPDCPRIITGKITNFLDKLGAENVSDKTIELLYTNHIIYNIKDLFHVRSEDLRKIPGIDVVSANNIATELNRVLTQDITISKLFGAIGIPNISEKKCRNIFKVITVDYLLNKASDKIRFKLLNADGIGGKTSDVFIDFIKENQSMVRFLVEHMNIIDDIEYKGNVVFTGFRNPELESKIKTYGYDMSDSVNNKTVAVITASTDHTSTKCTVAKKKGIQIINLSDIDDLFRDLKHGVKPTASPQYNAMYNLHFDD